MSAAGTIDLTVIDQRAERATAVPGRTVDGDATSEWTATFEDGRLLRITERMQRGDYAQGELRHYFVGGLHRVTHETRVATMLERDGAPTKDTITVRVHWASGGGVEEARKTVNGQDRPLQLFEAQELRTHVATLAQQALLRVPASAR